MIRLEKLNPRRYDVYATATGKCLGDFTQDGAGRFWWFHNLPQGTPVGSELLQGVAESLALLNREEGGKVQELYPNGEAAPEWPPYSPRHTEP